MSHKWRHISPDLYIDCACSLEDLQAVFTESTKGITRIVWYNLWNGETPEGWINIMFNNKRDPAKVTDVAKDSYKYYTFHASFTGDDRENLDERFAIQVLYVRNLVKQLQEAGCKVYLISFSEEYYED